MVVRQVVRLIVGAEGKLAEADPRHGGGPRERQLLVP
jgi:hypothetical protein